MASPGKQGTHGAWKRRGAPTVTGGHRHSEEPAARAESQSHLPSTASGSQKGQDRDTAASKVQHRAGVAGEAAGVRGGWALGCSSARRGAPGRASVPAAGAGGRFRQSDCGAGWAGSPAQSPAGTGPSAGLRGWELRKQRARHQLEVTQVLQHKSASHPLLPILSWCFVCYLMLF